MKVTLSEIINQETQKAIDQQNDDGSFLNGHNGPYFDNETPVRNTSHWLFTLCSLYERYGDIKYSIAANKAVDYLLSKKARPMNASFWCRTNPKKDFCNGLIGQAWVLEALIKAYEVLKRQECYDIAEEVYLMHPWDNNNKIWHRLNVDGSYGGHDGTFNHQLWFGAVTGFLNNTEDAIIRSKEFFEYVVPKLGLYNNGVIFHNTPLIRYKFKSNKPTDILRYLFQLSETTKQKKIFWSKSIGYHGFNLYALCLYKYKYPDHLFWESKMFRKILSAIGNKKFIKQQGNNKYSYPYNPTGIELAFVLETFKPDEYDSALWWLKEQCNQTLEPGYSIMTNHSNDKITSQARIYEATRLVKDYIIEINSNK